MQTFHIFREGKHTRTAWKVVPGSIKKPCSFTDKADGQYLATSFPMLDEAEPPCESLLVSDSALILYIVVQDDTVVDDVMDLPFMTEKTRKEDKKFAAKCWIGYFLISGGLWHGLMLAGVVSWPWSVGMHLGLSGLYLALLATYFPSSIIEITVASVILLILSFLLIPPLVG